MAEFAVLDVTRIILPRFRPEDDDTLRERVPIAIAYATWGLTSLIVLVVGWHRFRAYSTSAESP